MTSFLFVAAGLGIGAFIGWFLAQTFSKPKTEGMRDAFSAMAAEALQRNNEGFLTLAEQKFRSLQQGANSDLQAREKAIENLVEPLTKAVEACAEEAKQLEEKRLKDLGSLDKQLESLVRTQDTLQSETSKLVNALRSPNVRGRWGEITLRKTAELAGMSSHCDFIEQESVSTEDGRLRPDMIVKLPAGREVVVDAKVSLVAFMEAIEAKTDAERDSAMKRHAAQVSQHVNRLSARDYWDQFPKAPEFVVLFLSNDSLLAAAAEKDPNLVEAALSKKVIIATPATLIALLRAIAFGWRQEALAENAQKISVLGQEISDRMATLVEFLNEAGSGLRKAVESFNKAATSLETRLLPSARKFRELGTGGKKDIETLQPVDQVPRVVAPVESENGNPPKKLPTR